MVPTGFVPTLTDAFILVAEPKSVTFIETESFSRCRRMLSAEKDIKEACHVAHCILVDTSTVVCWTSPFVILGMSGFFVTFILFLMENSVSKQCKP